MIRHGGIQVFPRLVASDTRADVTHLRLTSGIETLDMLLGGGIERGTSTLITGAAGTGKSTLAAQFVHTAACRGEKSFLVVFDESRNTLLSRTPALGIDLRPHVESGLVTLMQVDPAELSPGELVYSVRQAVQQDKVAIVVIDTA